MTEAQHKQVIATCLLIHHRIKDVIHTHAAVLHTDEQRESLFKLLDELEIRNLFPK